MVLKPGISSPAFALEPFESVIERVSENFKLWEIVADISQLLPDIKTNFLELAPSYDLEYTIHAPFNDLNLAALNPELRAIAIKYLKDSIYISNDLGINLLSFHPGHMCPSGVYAPKKVLETNYRSIREIAQFVKDEGLEIQLALENMPLRNWTLGNTAEEILSMINGTELGICFDVGHAQIVGEVENFLAIVSKIKNVHLHDNKGRRDEHLVLGEGIIDVPKVINYLKRKYDGNIIIESKNLDEGLKSMEYLDKLI